MSRQELVLAFRKAVDFEKRFGYRTDIPEVQTNWEKVVDLIYELVEGSCQKKAHRSRQG
jgi:hypothetical protein